MFALGIIDKLGAEDLTGGKVIAGTGTIDDAGEVGPIGGIPQKLVGAKDAGAVAFLVPADNCDEAVDNAVPGCRCSRWPRSTTRSPPSRRCARAGSPPRADLGQPGADTQRSLGSL